MSALKAVAMGRCIDEIAYSFSPQERLPNRIGISHSHEELVRTKDLHAPFGAVQSMSQAPPDTPPPVIIAWAEGHSLVANVPMIVTVDTNPGTQKIENAHDLGVDPRRDLERLVPRKIDLMPKHSPLADLAHQGRP